MKYLVTLLTLCTMMLLGVTSATDATSIDVSALSSSTTRQIMASGHHIQIVHGSEFEASAKYAKSQGRSDVWDIGIDNVTYVWFLRTESDWRQFHNRSTVASAIGVGGGLLAISGGFRTDYPDNAPKEVFAKATATIRIKRHPYALTGKVEGLRAGAGNKRLDYRIEGRYQVGRFYVGIKAEELKHVELQALSLGISF